MNKLIVGSLIFLVFLIFFSILVGSFFGGKGLTQSGAPTPIPTSVLTQRSGIPVGLTAEQLKDRSLVQKEGRVYSQEQRERVDKFIGSLPQSTDDYELIYSDNLGKFYAQIKTSDGEQKLNDFLSQNNMSDIKNDYNHLFSVSARPVRAVLQKDEDALMSSRLNKSVEEVGESGDKTQTTQQQKDAAALGDLSSVLFDFTVPTLPPSAYGPAPGGKGGSGQIANPGALDLIFNEAGTKVGTPPKFLKAIMSIECGSMLSLPASLVAKYSKPGGGLPPGHKCYRNSIGAKGPMQFMGNTWPGYATAVNQFGGYTHAPNVENIRDSVYAAAAKFKSDGQPTGPEWTFAQIRRAYGCYAGGCNAYDGGRLGQDFERLFAMFIQRYNSF